MAEKLNPLRRCWAEIDLSVIRENAGLLQNHLGEDCKILAIVKADAYGHGLEEVAVALVNQVTGFGVANVSEALRVASATGSRNILILSPLTKDERETAVGEGFSCSVSTTEEVADFDRVAEKLNKSALLHAVADTGMGRMGAQPAAFPDLVNTIAASKNVHLAGVCTHFPNADEDSQFTRQQISLFREMIKGMSLGDCEIHLSNSAGIIDFSSETDYATLARPGLSLYGVSPECETKIDVRPALTWKSRITLVREVPAGSTISYGSTFTTERAMKVASVAVGYGDGYPRHLSDKDTYVLVGGTRCRLLGRVTMDQIVVDVTHLEAISSGDEVVLVGKQSLENIPVTEVAQKAGTIPWEIYTGITSRVDRVYI